ncbi:MAG TPA: hypothetical protein VMF30_03405 [Pirellulales bacterium]|nr:hypothetical protein [Pirellulales bacterium]
MSGEDSAEPVELDRHWAVVVCAGPSLDRLAAPAWKAIGQAGVVVGVNGALVADACTSHRVRFDYAAALDVATTLSSDIPGFLEAWARTPAWRVSAHGTGAVCESAVRRVESWSDEPDAGFAAGCSITAMVVGNWLSNAWPTDAESVRTLQAIEATSGKFAPPRRFRQLAYIGLDMIAGQGGHARGAGHHHSGFAASPDRYAQIADGWAHFAAAARERNIRAVNLTPNSGLAAMARIEPPGDWVRA